MKKIKAVSCTMLSAFVVSVAIGSGLAAAQQPQQSIDEVVVIAKPVTIRTAPPVTMGTPVNTGTVGRSTIGAPIELIELRGRVSYADLDLTKQADLAELDKRLNDAAKEACKDLARLYPVGHRDTRSCIGEALDSAKEQKQVVIAAAGKR